MATEDSNVRLVSVKSAYGTTEQFENNFLNRLALRDTFNSITLSWENINVFVPEDTGCCKKNKTKGKLHIIRDVDGIAKPGNCLAIMGASGAGKTTLLNVLNYRNRGNLEISGDVRINGQAISSALSLSAVSGYVQQDDLFVGTLTVREHLKFQSMLRMDPASTDRERNERVEAVINDLNLKKCENTLIGVPLKNIKGISGGEKRRLAFATEILTNPGLLFCDEPTSGLDSFMALTVVESMKNLAKQGKTIICTIHQPSSEIFENFDQLCLLAEGRLAYIGDLAKTTDFFASQGLLCPKNYNPADFYIQSLAIVPTNKAESKQKVKQICDGYLSSPYMNSLKEEILESRSQALSQDFNRMLEVKSPYKSNSFTQLKWLLWRNFKATARDPLATKVQIMQVIMIAVIFGLIYLRQELKQETVQNINGVLFLCITNSTFSNIFAVLNSFAPEIPIFLREHYNGMYKVINYYLAKILSELPGFIILPFIFVTIVYWMSNLNDETDRYLKCALTIIMVANAAVSCGAFFASLTSSVNAAIGIAGPILTPLMIFGGTFLNNNSIPDYFLWLKYLSWLGYANEILLVNQWKGVNFIPCDRNGTTCRFENGQDVLETFSMKESNVLRNFALIVTIYVVFRVLTFLMLLRKTYVHK